jgi:hypothetical protein
MNRYQQEPDRGRQSRRPNEPSARNEPYRSQSYDRPYDEDARYARYQESEYPFAAPQGYGAAADEDYASSQQYLGSYPSEQGPRYYGEDARASYPRSQRSPYGPDDFRQGAHPGQGYANQDYRQGTGARQWEGSRRHGQRQFARPGRPRREQLRAGRGLRQLSPVALRHPGRRRARLRRRRLRAGLRRLQPQPGRLRPVVVGLRSRRLRHPVRPGLRRGLPRHGQRAGAVRRLRAGPRRLRAELQPGRLQPPATRSARSTTATPAATARTTARASPAAVAA